MSLSLYKRSMKWRKDRDARVAEKRKESKTVYVEPGGASAGQHIDSYFEYNRLVGESDGGTLLSQAEYDKLRAKAAEASKNRLFVTWRCLPSGLDCYNVGPDSRCFCGHSYKAHAWYNTKSKRVHCRCPKCDCKGFDYIPGHGSFWPRCVCKHEHGDHRVRGVMGRCHKGRSCSCTGYHTAMSCACGYGWAEHATVIETRKERAASGRPCKTMGGDNVGSASSGAVTDFKALLPGVERVHVIGDAAYGNGGSSGGARALPRYGGAGGGAGAAAGGGGGGRGMLRDSGSSRRAGASAGAWRRNSTGSGSGNGSDSYTGSYNRRRGGRAGSKPGGSSSGYAAAVRSGSIKGGHET